MRLRPLNDLVLLRLDPKPEQKGIIIQTDTTTNHIRTGVVVEMGPGKWIPKKGDTPARFVRADIEIGERVAFWSANFVTTAGEQLATKVAECGDGLGLLRSTDLLFAVLPGVEVDFS